MANPNPKGLTEKTRNKRGRKPGVPNQITTDSRQMFQYLLEANLDKMQDWLDEIAEKSPRAAFELMLKMANFVIPQLARQEITTTNTHDFKNITFKFGNNGIHPPSETGGDNQQNLN